MHYSTEMEEWFEGINENVIFRMIVGKRFSEAAKSLNLEKGELLVREKLKGYLKLLGTFAISDVIPFLRWLDLFRVKRAMEKIAKEMGFLLHGWLEEHKKKRKMINNKNSKGGDDGDESPPIRLDSTVISDFGWNFKFGLRLIGRECH